MRAVSLAIGLFLSLFVQGQQVAKKIKASNGVNINFYQFTPKDYNDGKKHPVIIFLHGVGERGDGGKDLEKVAKVGIAKYIRKGETMQFTVNGKKESFVVLSPQLSKRYGTWPDFYVEEMIEYATKNLKIDPNRIYLTGLSLGGGGVWSFSSSKLANAKKLAAIVTVCATCRMSNGKNIADANLAVWSFHAKNDTRVSVNCTNSAIEKILTFKPSRKPKKTIWSAGNHNIWDKVYNPDNKNDENIYKWLLTIKRTGSANDRPDNNDDQADRDDDKPNPGGGRNNAPVARVDNYKEIRLPVHHVFVNGGGSYDPDGKIVDYQWRKISGPRSYQIINDKYSRTKIRDLTAGTYVFQLTVTDNKGSKSKANVRVLVRPAKRR